MDAKTSNGESRKVQVLPLSPLHIGSGDVLKGKHDYAYFSKEKQVVLLDHAKALALFPEGGDPIPNWLDLIKTGGDLLTWLQTFKPDLGPSDVALPGRVIDLEGNAAPRNGQDFHPFLQTGTGKALLPGSSLKGALRTVLWRHLLRERYPQKMEWEEFAEVRKKSEKEKQWDEPNRYKFSDKKSAKLVFGKNPNVDMLRCLQVGDVDFEKTKCYKVRSLNLLGDGWGWKRDSLRFVEAVPPEEEAIGSLKLLQLQGAERKGLPGDLRGLFALARSHARDLLQRELEFWENEKDVCPSPDYLFALEGLLAVQEGLEEDECILRLGYGSGYTWMTGGWQPDHLNQEDQEDLGFHLRDLKYEDDPPFPKTRALASDCLPMGFVKLRLL